MIKRIYIDNYGSLMNFELKLDRLNLFLGENGTGKTTVFEAIYRLQQFIGGNQDINTLFPARDRTRWLQKDVQTFEMDIQIEEDFYSYKLQLEFDHDKRRMLMKREKLSFNTDPILDYQVGKAELYNDNDKKSFDFLPDWERSGISTLLFHKNKKLSRFHDEMRRIIVAGICPPIIYSESFKEDNILNRYMENFASWYHYLFQEQPGSVMQIFSELKKVMPGFKLLRLIKTGENNYSLRAEFNQLNDDDNPMKFDFRELSDGQRVLIILYSLIYGMKDNGLYLFLDEPDNYVALREIQPWLMALQDSLGEGVEQAVLISHHPEIIDQLAVAKGRWFDRDGNGPVRVSDEPPSMTEGLSPSQNIARGWVNE